VGNINQPPRNTPMTKAL